MQTGFPKISGAVLGMIILRGLHWGLPIVMETTKFARLHLECGDLLDHEGFEIQRCFHENHEINPLVTTNYNMLGL